jgi:hypothetical protein
MTDPAREGRSSARADTTNGAARGQSGSDIASAGRPDVARAIAEDVRALADAAVTVRVHRMPGSVRVTLVLDAQARLLDIPWAARGVIAMRLVRAFPDAEWDQPHDFDLGTGLLTPGRTKEGN